MQKRKNNINAFTEAARNRVYLHLLVGGLQGSAPATKSSTRTIFCYLRRRYFDWFVVWAIPLAALLIQQLGIASVAQSRSRQQ
ncbi:hypothetical protein F511_38405 [Dorcoceras hygrometricum]|uniref:Uncharacterized protein n=1 Tax=Dorcoceras hygrometricum TaxID=472368 RepID=A0A2Z7BG86_9LAMI|nr:hypothetical protein F511_38405 [Dorcoceras hygrometricum]